MDANKKFDILNQVNDDIMIKVIRNGNLQEVPKKDIVVGDIVLLETGEDHILIRYSKANVFIPA